MNKSLDTDNRLRWLNVLLQKQAEPLVKVAPSVNRTLPSPSSPGRGRTGSRRVTIPRALHRSKLRLRCPLSMNLEMPALITNHFRISRLNVPMRFQHWRSGLPRNSPPRRQVSD
jgi:hypothetical protein